MLHEQFIRFFKRSQHSEACDPFIGRAEVEFAWHLTILGDLEHRLGQEGVLFCDGERELVL